jgi:hypothetical protein
MLFLSYEDERESGGKAPQIFNISADGDEWQVSSSG